MLVIRASQMEVLQQAAHRGFEDDAWQHLSRQFPLLCKRLGEATMRNFIRDGELRAERYGFTVHRTLFAYFTLMVWLGRGYDEDPLYPWAGRILSNPLSAGQLDKAIILQDATLDYMERAEGPDNEHLKAVLRRLQTTTYSDLVPTPAGDFETYMLRWLESLHPRKCQVVGESALRELTRKGKAAAGNYGFTTERGFTVYIAMMFLLGAHFDRDPLLPWIQRALTRPPEADQRMFVYRLYRAGMAYLRNVAGEMR